MSLLAEPSVACPYCGETFTILVDCSAGDQIYVEDCFVCCQPIEMHVEVAPDGRLMGVHTQPENP